MKSNPMYILPFFCCAILRAWVFMSIAIGLCFCNNLAAQNENISFVPLWGKQAIEPETFYYLPAGDSLQFENVLFYISHIHFLKDKRVIFAEKNSYHLLDFNDTSTLETIKIPQNCDFDALQFCVGIDSSTTISGAMGGDLDPTKGMYWTWQSGYIHIKIEGTSPICPTRKQAFQFHLGGYLPPYQSLQTIQLPYNQQDKKPIKIGIDLQYFFNHIDLKTQHSIMIPSKEAVILSTYFAQSFLIMP